ncbi:hypothetical protein MKX01_029832 [Papaver californicum]|nr:hypothetical protein MKX01_029832 [Papaver californicum]
MEEDKIKTPNANEIKYRGIKKLGTFRISSNFLLYVTTVFNIKHVTAAIVISVYHGTTFFTPLIGGYIADAYLGRFKTLCFASSFFCGIGMLLVTLTAVVSILHPPDCKVKKNELCIQPTAPQWAFLLFVMGFLVFASKRSVNSFINWYYFVLASCLVVSMTLIAYVQSNLSWSIGLALPSCLMFIACILLFLGSRIYVKVKPEGSPVTTVIQVLVAATRKWKLNQLENPEAAIVTVDDLINADGSAANRLCRIQQVEEVKCLVRVLPIWASTSVFHIPTTLLHTYAVFQALQSDRHLGKFQVPAASYIAFCWLSMSIWIPIYDRLIVPSLRKITGQEGCITILQRIGIGTLLSAIMMLVSAVIEQRRRNTALTFPILGTTNGGGAISSMSALWLIPQLSISGLADAFSVVSQVEFYYKQFPENMKSMGMSVYLLGFTVGSYASGFMVSIVHQTTKGAATGNWLPEDLNEGRLGYFCYIITAIGVVNIFYFVLCSRWYRYK